MKAKQAWKFSHFVLAAAVAGSAATGLPPAPLQSQEIDEDDWVVCRPVEEDLLFCSACRSSWFYRLIFPARCARCDLSK